MHIYYENDDDVITKSVSLYTRTLLLCMFMKFNKSQMHTYTYHTYTHTHTATTHTSKTPQAKHIHIVAKHNQIPSQTNN